MLAFKAKPGCVLFEIDFAPEPAPCRNKTAGQTPLRSTPRLTNLGGAMISKHSDEKSSRCFALNGMHARLTGHQFALQKV